jgi:hypothetical protein
MRIDYLYADFAAREAHRREFIANVEARIAIEVAKRKAARSTSFWARLWFILNGP